MKRSLGIGVILTIRINLLVPFLLLSTPGQAWETIKVHQGDCALEQQQEDLNEPPYSLLTQAIVCAKAQINLHSLYISNRSFALIDKAKFYGASHFGNFYSLHVQGIQERGGDSKKDYFIDRKEIDLAVIQIGNPAYDHWRLLIGKQKPAFGVNRNPFNEFPSFLDPITLWESPHPSLRFVYDSQDKFTVEVETACQSSKELGVCRDEYQNHFLYSTRLMYDISIFNGTRFILSHLGDFKGKRQFGLGIVNITPDNNIFHIEWNRTRTTPDGKHDPFAQLLRIAFEDSPKKKVRNLVLYDDLRGLYRLFGLGGVVHAASHIDAKFALFYKKDETLNKRHRWFFDFGLSTQL